MSKFLHDNADNDTAAADDRARTIFDVFFENSRARNKAMILT